MDTLQQKRERVDELTRQIDALQKERSRLTQEIAEETCPLTTGQLFTVAGKGWHEGLWLVEDVCSYRQGWKARSRNVKKDGTPGLRTTWFSDSDAKYITLEK